MFTYITSTHISLFFRVFKYLEMRFLLFFYSCCYFSDKLNHQFCWGYQVKSWIWAESYHSSFWSVWLWYAVGCYAPRNSKWWVTLQCKNMFFTSKLDSPKLLDRESSAISRCQQSSPPLPADKFHYVISSLNTGNLYITNWPHPDDMLNFQNTLICL